MDFEMWTGPEKRTPNYKLLCITSISNANGSVSFKNGRVCLSLPMNKWQDSTLHLCAFKGQLRLPLEMDLCSANPSCALNVHVSLLYKNPIH